MAPGSKLEWLPMNDFRGRYLRIGIINDKDVWITYYNSKRGHLAEFKHNPYGDFPAPTIMWANITYLPQMGMDKPDQSEPLSSIKSRISTTWYAHFKGEAGASASAEDERRSRLQPQSQASLPSRGWRYSTVFDKTRPNHRRTGCRQERPSLCHRVPVVLLPALVQTQLGNLQGPRPQPTEASKARLTGLRQQTSLYRRAPQPKALTSCRLRP